MPNRNAVSRNVEMRKSLRFPQKLWIMVNDGNGIAEWSRNGSAICLDIEALDTYLQSEESIFRMKGHCAFERHMLLYGFKRIGSHTSVSGRAGFATKEPDEMEFRNESFKRDRPYLVDAIRRSSATNDRNLNILRKFRTDLNERSGTKSDPCRRLRPQVWSKSMLKSARFRLRTVLLERYVRAMLSQKLDRCVQTNDWSIELEADVFENAVDSVSGFEQREVAGFYGHSVSSEQIKSFFGEYLPTYSNDEGMSSLTASSTKNQEPFGIPQFQIVANDPKSNDINQYSLQPVHETHDKRNTSSTSVQLMPHNQLMPIHYDTSFIDSMVKQSTMETDSLTTRPDQISQIKNEFIAQPQPKDDADHFEFDQFFLMKPKEQEPELDSSLNSTVGSLKIETDKESSESNDSALDVSNVEITKANDIIQQAAIIDDDFFSQIRESMDVLYDKVLC